MSTELSQERVLEEFDYDAKNGLLIRKEDEYGRVVNRPCGHKPTPCGYGYVGIDGKSYPVHRVIWLWYYGEWPEHEIDHIDQNKMNNRINNLRAATPSENQHNKGLRRDNSSGYPGVTFDKKRNKFMAYIHLNGKRIFLGRYSTPEEAFLNYMIAKIKYHPSSPISQQYLRELTLAG